MKEVVDILINNNKTISTMESCTGGYIVNAITNISGASEVIKYSAITYSNEFKIKMGIPKELIEKYTVYSQEVADAMSKQISLYTNSDYGIGVTGKLNKPDPANPYGSNNLTYISIYSKEEDKFYPSTITCTKENRSDNKELVLQKIIEILLNIL